jgi:hypothetical protein
MLLLQLPLAVQLGTEGYQLMLQGLALRPLDLIGYTECRAFLVGSVGRFVETSLPVSPNFLSTSSGPNVPPQIGLGPIVAAKLIESFIKGAGVQPPDWKQLVEAEQIALEYAGLEIESLDEPELDRFLDSSVVRSNNPILNDFMFSGGLFVVTSVLRARTLKVRLQKPLEIDFTFLRESLLPEITPMLTGWNEVLLEAGRPAVLGVRGALLRIENTLRLSTPEPSNMPLLANNVVPYLEPYTRAPSGQYHTPVSERREYVVLPDRGVRLPPEDNSRARAIFEQMHNFQNETTVTIDESPDVRMFVLDSISPLEPKLVRMNAESANALQGLHLGLRVEPLIRYEMTAVPSFKLTPVPGVNLRVSIKVVCAVTGNPVEGAEVVAITDWQNQYGESGKTDAKGEVHLPLGALPVQLDRLYVKPPARGHWGAYRSQETIITGYAISLTPVDPTYTDAVRQIYGTASLTDGEGVKVAVIDCGVGPHPDLVVFGGRNVVRGEQSYDTADNGDGHGTHVAGIIAGRGSPRGVAPGVELYSYRVVGNAQQAPDNYVILKALIYACDDGCEIANLSLGLDQSSAPHDETLKRAIEDSRDRGCVVIAAAGNSGKKPVTRLAKYVSAEGLAISAIGRKGTFPHDSLEASDIEPNLSGANPNDFVAEFSSFGDDVSLTAPGVGTISTAPNGGYRPLSGTSMAAPVIAGLIARLIQLNTPPLPALRDWVRAGEILNRAVKAAKRLGFPREREGAGLPF